MSSCLKVKYWLIATFFLLNSVFYNRNMCFGQSVFYQKLHNIGYILEKVFVPGPYIRFPHLMHYSIYQKKTL